MGKKNGKKKGGGGGGGQWGAVQLGGFRMSFPKPRIPRLLGSAQSLSAANSVYPRVDLDVPFVGSQQAIAAGALSVSIPLDTTAVANFSTRFGSVFREYAIVGANIEVRCQGPIAAQQGMFVAAINEKDGTAPSASILDCPRVDVLISTTESPNVHKVKWAPRDFLDLQWTGVATNVIPAWLKLFASQAATFTGAATTANVVVTGTLALSFRGYFGD